MEGFIKDGLGVLKSLQEAGPGLKLPAEAPVCVKPFKGKDGLNLGLQGWLKNASLRSRRELTWSSGEKELRRV